jgi:integrase
MKGSPNAARELRGTVETRRVEHMPAMAREELPDFLRRLEVANVYAVTRLAIKMVLLTLTRTQEIRGARWEEFDLDGRLWTIPADRMKMKIEHRVPLSVQALEVLEQLRPFSEPCSGHHDPSRMMSENAMLYALWRMGYRGKATVHGFRATGSTILNERGFNPDAIERQLAHAERNKIRAAYHRSEYMEERRKMMDWWGDYLDQLKEEEK